MNTSSDARVALVAIGDELLAGKHPDLNSPWIAERLLDLDLSVDRITVANDDLAELTEVFRSLCARYEYVFSSGGLGPTLDDITRHAAACACGVSLERNTDVLAELQRWWSERGYAMSSANERQALFPEGATVIENRVGTAPGFRIQVGDSWLICLPGPPREIQIVFDEEVFSWLAECVARSGNYQRLAKQSFFLYGVSESRFAEEVGSWMERPQNPLMSVTANLGVLTVVLRAWANTSEAAAAGLAPRVHEFRALFGDRIFSETQASLAAALGAELLRHGLRLTTAESCTGGLVSSQLTELSGISGAFTHGFVTYSNQAKSELLGVSKRLDRATRCGLWRGGSGHGRGSSACGRCRPGRVDYRNRRPGRWDP